MKFAFLLSSTLMLSACTLFPGEHSRPIGISDFDRQAYNIVFVENAATTTTHAAPIISETQRNALNIIAADLARSGRFRPTFETSQQHLGKDEKLDVEYWTEQGIDFVVSQAAVSPHSNSLSLTLWDIQHQKRRFTMEETLTPPTLRQTAHRISDRIFSDVLGVKGSYSSKLVYITVVEQEQQRRYHLWLADADGHNKTSIFSSDQPIMSPSWSPSGDKIIFASLHVHGQQQIYIHDWREGHTQHVDLEKPGLIGSPAWSPSGEKLAFTLIRAGNADIYTVDLSNNELLRLTCHRAIDTEAAWSPDEKTIVFTSDRSGRPQIYEVPASGGNAKRVTFRGKENAQASVSPNGIHIAMLHSHQGKYRIALLNRQTGHIKLLTFGDLDESPSFSADGSMVIYSSYIGKKVALATVSVDGKSKHRLRIEDDIRDPAWSPVN